MRTSRGFTLVELMIVVVVIGVLAAIAIPNFISLRGRAKEAGVRSNMHVVQISMEDFSVLNNATYPTSVADALPDGRTIVDVCPWGRFPENPFTGVPSVVQFNAEPSSGVPGEMGVNPAQPDGYRLKGNGAQGDTLKLVLTNGQ